ncbi:cell wall-binding repeat-containing protein [Agromyces sp. C10]|uniref:cell wall-binding repeat-containing protein n=1 Tax=Agromyces sp. C10 TaxID=2935077 RepID=UPI00200B7C7B|nr:cell wall-binding repeat-containing protein [Agromyces sp. C10]MCK8610653.1 cell wall-binding repeat-containing protein [Agromyces sp. C10]
MKSFFASLAAIVITAATLGAAPVPVPVPAHAGPAEAAGPLVAAAGPPPVNRIVRENRLAGHSSWQIPWSGYSLSTDRDLAVKAYATKVSIDNGEQVDFRVHVASAGSVRYDVYRLGWYQGLGGRRVTGGTFNGISQPACTTAMPVGMVTCDWRTLLTVQTTEDWTSGVYAVVFTRGTKQTYASFVLRDDGATGKLVHVQPSFTYQAYNNFPDNGSTGKSLYSYNSYGATTAAGSTAAAKVSFDRPYANAGASLIMAEEAPMIRYAESRGFDMTYATNLDLHRNPSLLNGQQGMVSVGHDEYWTSEMFTAAETARDAGVDLAYLGGNNMYWQVRVEPSASGAADRVVVCYKSASLDPVKGATSTVLFRAIPRPEQPVIGQMWPTGDGTGLVGPNASWIVRTPEHWLYRGTGLANGSAIPGMVGIEADRRHTQYPAPTVKSGTTQAVLAQSPFTARNGQRGLHESTLYQAPSSAIVFSAGTLNYTGGLMGGNISPQPTVRTMTTNLFTRYSGMALDATTDRAGGSDRYATAVALAQRGFPNTGVPVVYLATGATFPDALAAGAATRGEGPVLLVPGSSIPQNVLDELARLKPAKLVVVGGPTIVTDAVVAQASAAAGVTAVRDSGPDRYATAAKVSQRAFSPGVPVAYVASGADFPDALSAGAAAAQLGGPVLLTASTSLPAATKTELDRLNPQRIVVVGSAGAVSESVRTSMTAYASQVIRLGGSDRYETAAAVARDLVAAGGANMVGVATGLSFPDGLAAGPVVAANGGVLMLVGSALTPTVAEEIVRGDPRVVLLAGSEGVISASVASGIAGLFSPPAMSSPNIALKSVPNDPSVPDTGPQDETIVSPELRPELPWLDTPAAEHRPEQAGGGG